MDFDVVSKLFPNILTMITQLLATFIIFILYKKFLHEPVLAYLDKRQAIVADELASAKGLNEEAQARKAASEAEYAQFHQELNALKTQMVDDAKKERDAIIASAQVEVDKLRAANMRALESERAALYAEVEDYIFDVASLVNKRVLEDITFNEADMLKALAKEIDSDEYQH